MPIASRVLTCRELGKPPATPGHKIRRVFLYGIYGTGVTLPATRNRADVARARRATPSISAGQSVGPARGDTYIPAAQPSQSPGNVPGSISRFGRTRPVTHSACNGLDTVSDSRELGVSALRIGHRSVFHVGRDVCCGSR